MPQGARIYNLFPLLAGPLPAWEKHLDRIAAMGFDWVFLNPVHYPGFSGSLYAVKDYYALNPLLTDGVRSSPEASLSEFLKAAEARGIAVMMDLVVNHTAKDSPLTEQHPEWFMHEPDGSLALALCRRPGRRSQARSGAISPKSITAIVRNAPLSSAISRITSATTPGWAFAGSAAMPPTRCRSRSGGRLISAGRQQRDDSGLRGREPRCQ